MMVGGSSYNAAGQQMAVISPQFCVNHPIDLNIVRKLRSFKVTDVNGSIMFTIKGKLFSLHERRVLYDLAGNPLITFHPKFPSAHGRWVVFRGESTDSKDLLFSVKRSSFFQMKSKQDVFLATNPGEELCDFKVEGSWLNRSCVIYAGDSSNIVAEMRPSSQSILLGKHTSMVTVYPDVDYAFIVALVVILQETVYANASAPSS